MSSSNKKRDCVSSVIMDAARVISELKGEKLEDLEAKFYMDYVEENLNLLTEKARDSLLKSDVKQNG